MRDFSECLQFFDRISLSGIEVFGYHGVYAEENRSGQRFLVDADLYVDARAAGDTDCLEDTVDYSVAAQKIVQVLGGEPRALLEKIAAQLADELLAMPGVQVVRLCVHKPDAPIGAPKDDVTLTIWRGLENASGWRSEARFWGGDAPRADLERAQSKPTESRQVVIALGGNLGEVPVMFTRALRALQAEGQVQVKRISPLVRTVPVLSPTAPEQPAYYNAVALLTTTLSPLALLERMQAVETRFGRVRSELHGPRTLDLDLISYQGVTCRTPQLELPHPRAAERAFVLLPWSYVDSEAHLEGYGMVRELVQRAADYNGIMGLYQDWWLHPHELGSAQLPLPLLYVKPAAQEAPRGADAEKPAAPHPLSSSPSARETPKVSAQCLRDSAVLSAFHDRLGESKSPLLSDLLAGHVRAVNQQLQEQEKLLRRQKARAQLSLAGPPKLFRSLSSRAPEQLHRPFWPVCEMQGEETTAAEPRAEEEQRSQNHILEPDPSLSSAEDDSASGDSATVFAPVSWREYSENAQRDLTERKRVADAWTPPSLEHFRPLDAQNRGVSPVREESLGSAALAGLAAKQQAEEKDLKPAALSEFERTVPVARTNPGLEAASIDEGSHMAPAKETPSSAAPATPLRELTVSLREDSGANSLKPAEQTREKRVVPPELAQVWAGLARSEEVLTNPVSAREIFPSLSSFRAEVQARTGEKEESSVEAQEIEPSGQLAENLEEEQERVEGNVEPRALPATHTTGSLPVVTAFDPQSGTVPTLAALPVVQASPEELERQASQIVEREALAPSPLRRSVLRPAPSGVRSVPTGEIPVVARVQGASRLVDVHETQDSPYLPRFKPVRGNDA